MSLRTPEQIAAAAGRQMRQVLAGLPVSADQHRQLESILLHAVGTETSVCHLIIGNTPAAKAREALHERLNPLVLLYHPDGRRRRENTTTADWTDWFPGLDNDDLTLGNLYRRLPGFSAEEVPYLVRLFENPASPIAFRGAVTLQRHDLIHLLVGRGLLDQDEAFVLGYTMGTARGLTRVERFAFKRILTLYPEPFRIHPVELRAYDLGVEAGRRCGTPRLYDEPLEEAFDETLGALRRRLGIDTAYLRGIYRREASLLPGTISSLRLPL